MINYDVGVFLRHTEMENMYVRELIEIVNQDTKAYTFKFTLYDNETPFDLTGRIVYLITRSKSGTVVQDKGTVTSAKSGLAEITLPNDMFCEEGTYQAEVQIWEGTSRLTSLPFDYNVRLSLQTNESVVADTRYSLLQEALENVAAADSTSTEAINTANQAKAICDDLVPKANTAAQNAQEALDRAESVVTQEELAQKVMLDGKDTKFDFIENQVVQEGLFKGSSFTIKDRITFQVEFIYDGKQSGTIIQLGASNVGGFNLYVDAARKKIVIYVSNGTVYTVSDLENISAGNYRIVIMYENERFNIIINNNNYEVDASYMMKATRTPHRDFGDGLLYDNVILTSQEIERNFQVLKNTPSIKELHATDSTGKTSILKLASDTDHVEDRAGRTQEQINRTFYKRMCKEMPSQNGEPITVKNGEEGYVLSAEIKGNTQLFKRAKGSQDEWIVIPNDEGRDTVAFEYKLDSTQAIISNNGEKYPIYATEEDKANKKVISLPFEEDKVTLNDDGSATWIKAGETNLVLTGVENWVLKPDYSSDITLTCMCDLNVSKKDNVVICDKLNYITTPELKSKRGVYGGGWNGAIYMSLLKTELETADLSGFKKWLSINKPSFTYMIESHVTTHIPKELMPTILTDKTNILEVGGAVKPSSFKVTLPVDRIAELTARLEAVESKTNTQPVNTAFVDETYAKSVNKIEEVIK